MSGKEWAAFQGCMALLGSRYIVLVFPHFLPAMQNPIFIVEIKIRKGFAYGRERH